MSFARGRRPSSRYIIVLIVAVIAIISGIAVPSLADGSAAKLSASGRVKAHPPPSLFPSTDLTDIAPLVAKQGATADALMAEWWKTHGPVRDDASFASWLEAQIPAPPTAAARARELKPLEALDKQRTPAGVKAATWLEVYGKKDIWHLYLHDQRELESPQAGKVQKKQLKAMLKMAKTASDALASKYQQSAPYVLEPSLRTDHVVAKGATCPCSYPSRHAARTAAAATYLSFLAPQRRSDYVWMQDEVAYSRLYMAGHVQSDITAGTLLGDMIGLYFIRSSDANTPQ